MQKPLTVSEAIAFRRSVRNYTYEALDDKIVKRCIENATQAPNSSNMQLWEFIHVKNPKLKELLNTACFKQQASRTAERFVIVVVRRDLWKKRARANAEFIAQNKVETESQIRRQKFALRYYQKLMPTIYGFDNLRILSNIKKISTWVSGIFRPIYRQVSINDMRIVTHKSAGLAAQNFMLSMAEVEYDTCPMEGFDSKLVKKALDVPKKAEINMILACGKRSENGIYGKRFRVPFKEVYSERF
tara:strand:+ start:9382 stop:10113 length:732 start_codon:yes stop_codon:yes gene_type:complete